MTQGDADGQQDAAAWRGVDEGWGRRAVDFSTLSEPANAREYVAMHQQLGVGPGDRLLDVACGAGLAVELAGVRGASCAGIDASPRLIDVARDRSPSADLRVGDMHALPWDDGVFDVVTSFRGIWGTTPGAVAEIHRVLAAGGRVGITVWGHIKRSPGAWALAPFAMASPAKVANQAAMVALGRPGAGEDLLGRAGFVDIERVEVPFVWEFADPEAYARALASTGPAYEAMQAVGEEAFLQSAADLARERVREGLPLRAPIAVVGFVARKPVATGGRRDHGDEHGVDEHGADERGTAGGGLGAGFLAVPASSPAVQRLYDDDVEELGYVMNSSKLWAHQPDAQIGLFGLLGQVAGAGSLSFRQRGILVTACASALGDAYCSLAWGNKLAGAAGADLAAGVLQGDDDRLERSERAMARWARKITRDPNATDAGDVQALRDAGFDDATIFAITAFVALRIAFSTVNDALGARPDHALAESVPAAVRDAVTFGRPVSAGEG
ncbi:MAG: methyltransferase domain-containing protein [Acidimicrobiia bacterium]